MGKKKSQRSKKQTETPVPNKQAVQEENQVEKPPAESVVAVVEAIPEETSADTWDAPVDTLESPINKSSDSERSYERGPRKSFNNSSSSRDDSWTGHSSNTRQNNWRDDRNRSSRNSSHKNDEFSKYRDAFYKDGQSHQFRKVKEMQQDLLKTPNEFSLGHCVAEDMNMSRGIAVLFRQKFHQVGQLLNQNQTTGGLAILQDKERFIYYLVTKPYSSGKPSYESLFSSLVKMREHILKKSVRKLALPKIGCGLDLLEWDRVKFMLDFIFKDVDIEIIVCLHDAASSSSPVRYRNSNVVNERYPIEEIEKGTIIIYFASEDGAITEEMSNLDSKFNFLGDFQRSRKVLGQTVLFDKNNDYYLYGCIVKKQKNDPIDFEALHKCIVAINKENNKKFYEYLGFQAVNDSNEMINVQVVNIVRNAMKSVEIYVCWPKELHNGMPRGGFDTSASYEMNNSSTVEKSSSSYETNNSTTENSFSPAIETTIDHAFELFNYEVNPDEMEYVIVQEKVQNIFELTNHSKVFYVTEIFDKATDHPLRENIDDNLGELLNQRQKEGGVAFLKVGNNYEYYLIIKKLSANQPIVARILFNAVSRLKDLVKQHRVQNLAVGNLRFTCYETKQMSDVASMFEHLMNESNTKVLICNFEEYTSVKTKNRNFTHFSYPLSNTRKKTVILYMASVNGTSNKSVDALEKKFHIKEDFGEADKTLGGNILHSGNEDYVIYGCIVKKNDIDSIDFVALQKSLKFIRNTREGIKKMSNVGFEAQFVAPDDTTNWKLLKMVLGIFDDFHICMLWDGECKPLMPPKK